MKLQALFTLCVFLFSCSPLKYQGETTQVSKRLDSIMIEYTLFEDDGIIEVCSSYQAVSKNHKLHTVLGSFPCFDIQKYDDETCISFLVIHLNQEEYYRLQRSLETSHIYMTVATETVGRKF